MPTSRAGGARVWLTRLAPYAFAVLALAWVFHTTRWADLRVAIVHAPITLFVAISAVMLVLNCAADTFAMQRVFGWFGCRVPYSDLFFVRASTYLLAAVNYHVGQAAIVGYLYRARNVPLLRASGWILFIIGINVGTLFLLASVGAWSAIGTDTLVAELRRLLAFSSLRQSTSITTALAVIPVAAILGALAWAIILRIRPAFLANRRVFAPLFEMGITGHIKGVLVRLPHIGVLCAWHVISLRLFGVHVPVLQAITYLPIYFAVASLPINVNGLGAAQFVAVALFMPFARDEMAADPEATGRAAVMAYSLSTAMVSLFLNLGLGILCLRRATQLGLPRDESPEEFEAEAAAAVVADVPASSLET